MSDDVDRTDDGRYIVVNGRRWRASDPRIPERLRHELVAELMAARRAVGAAKRSTDVAGEAAARRRVADAKLALGERGRPWWESVDEESLVARSAAAARTLLRHRSADSSICPSEVARVARFEAWRDHMPTTRRSVEELLHRHEVVITRGDARTESFDGGPVRVRRGSNFPDPPSPSTPPRSTDD